MTKEQMKDRPRKKGFNVGPANLPDGTYRRKVVKIKKALIHKAKVKKTFSKTITKEGQSIDVAHAAQANKYLEEAAAQKQEEERAKERKLAEDATGGGADTVPNKQMHPQRQAALEALEVKEAEDQREGAHWQRRPKRPKTSSFKREEDYAAKIQAEREAAIKEADQRKKAHEQKEMERRRRAKVMNARTGKGQQKLGKQGTMLLDKVKAQMAIS